MEKHPTDVRLVFKQFPLDEHSQAGLAAEAALAAHAQGKFWPMHDILYAHFREISGKNIFLWFGEWGRPSVFVVCRASHFMKPLIPPKRKVRSSFSGSSSASSFRKLGLKRA